MFKWASFRRGSDCQGFRFCGFLSGSGWNIRFPTGRGRGAATAAPYPLRPTQNDEEPDREGAVGDGGLERQVWNRGGEGGRVSSAGSCEIPAVSRPWPGWTKTWSGSAGRYQARLPSAPRDRPRPPPPAAPFRSPARPDCAGVPEVVLRHRPIQRNPLARPFLQRLAIGRDRLLQPLRAALPLAQARAARSRGCSASSPNPAEPARACIPSAPRDRPRPPPPTAPFRSPARPGSGSAFPRLFCVIAQSSGTRSRVYSFSASR